MAFFSKKTENTQPAQTDKPKLVTATVPIPQVLRRPRLSEKAMRLSAQRKYVFVIQGQANKVEIKKAVEKFYTVKVSKVHVINNKPKVRRYANRSGKTSALKKAVVTLTKDSKQIDILPKV